MSPFHERAGILLSVSAILTPVPRMATSLPSRAESVSRAIASSSGAPCELSWDKTLAERLVTARERFMRAQYFRKGPRLTRRHLSIVKANRRDPQILSTELPTFFGFFQQRSEFVLMNEVRGKKSAANQQNGDLRIIQR